MASTPAQPRPRPIVLAGWMILVGTLLTVVAVFDQARSLGSLQMAETIDGILDNAVFADLNVSASDIESFIKTFGMIAAVCATTMAILTVQLLRERSKSARLWISILVVPFFITSLASGGFLPTLVAFGVTLLWGQQAREWFAGTWKPTPPAGVRPERLEGRNQGSVRNPDGGRDQKTSISKVWPPSAPAAPSAPATPGAAESPAEDGAPRPVTGWPPVSSEQTTPWPPHTPPAAGGRPSSILAAALLTWIFSMLALGAFVVIGIATLADPAALMDQLRETNPEVMAREDVTESMVQAALVFLIGIVALWSISACVLAGLVMRGVAWARIVLMICAGAAALLLMLMAAVQPILGAPLIAAALTVGLLARSDSKKWVSTKKG